MKFASVKYRRSALHATNKGTRANAIPQHIARTVLVEVRERDVLHIVLQGVDVDLQPVVSDEGCGKQGTTKERTHLGDDFLQIHVHELNETQSRFAHERTRSQRIR